MGEKEMADNTPQLLPEEKPAVPDQNWKTDHIVKQEAEARNARIRILRRGLVLLALLSVVAAGIWYVLFQVNQFTLTVTIKGDPEIILEYGNAYHESGVNAVLTGTLFWKEGVQPRGMELEINSELREKVVGKYTITYTARCLWWEASAQRTVRVVDSKPPRITLMNSSNQTVLPGEKYEEEGYYAIDNYDGDITHLVRRIEEFGVVQYVVKDSSGNPAYAERKIPYYDPVPPGLYLNGDDRITITAGTLYEEPGYSASDDADGDLTDQVVTEGTVKWYRAGTYKINYQVTDTYGNLTRAIRIVKVEPHSRPEIENPKGKVIYLTFDDGPGPYTGTLLDLLERYDVKATFFVTDSGYDAMMKRIVDEGHSIGIHTMTHDYNTIYASEEAFFADLYGMQNVIYENTGVMTTLMRFPGGGSNLVSNFNEGIMSTLTEAVQDCGFQYFDWNVDSNDAGGALKSMTVSNNVIENVQKQRISMVLQHDTNGFSVDAVEDIIVWGLENGYTFLPITENSPNFHHDVLN